MCACVNIINIDLVKCIHTVIRDELWYLVTMGRGEYDFSGQLPQEELGKVFTSTLFPPPLLCY